MSTQSFRGRDTLGIIAVAVFVVGLVAVLASGLEEKRQKDAEACAAIGGVTLMARHNGTVCVAKELLLMIDGEEVSY